MNATGNVIIIPAYNEEQSIPLVINDIPKNLVDEIIVVNNNSTDKTADVLQSLGITALFEPQRGYGKACLKGIDHLKNTNRKIENVIFMDADYSDHPEELPLLLEQLNNGYEMVIGSRIKSKREKGSLTLQQRFGNKLAVGLIRVFHKHRYYDLGPFRGIKYEALQKLNMQDQNYGWTVEMQIKAVKQKLKIADVPVSYRKRIGTSKISGTLKGTVLAGYKIIKTIFKYR